jgi:hypothetical protein
MAVASAEHVLRGRKDGFMQVCHGKAAPLQRVQPGDRVTYYSPTVSFQGKDRLQAFTAIGIVKPGAPYLFDMGGGFRPFRRDVTWLPSRDAPIQPLLEALDFSAGIQNWGYRLRSGLVLLSERDMRLIAAAMGARLPEDRAQSEMAGANGTP